MKVKAFSLLFLTTVLLSFQACNSTNFPVPAGLLQTNQVGNSGHSAPLPQVFPKVILTTKNAAPVVSKDDYVSGDIVIDPNGNDSAWAFSATMKIKGRGNSTWGMPKKPYKIKLDSAASVLGAPIDKEWVLLANYSDKTLMRTALAMEMGRRLGLEYNPRTQFVEVSLNGVDLGNYTLTEQIKISASRVNAVSTDVTGGYLLELDQRRDEVNRFETSRTVPYTIKEPSTLTTEQTNYISNYVQTAEDVLYSATFADPVDGYAKYIDVDSFINAYIVQEIFKNQDAADFSSIYFYKSSGGKLKMGPLWDFDLGLGNTDYSSASMPEGFWIRAGSPWFKKLFQDPAFEARVKARWALMQSQGMDLDSLLGLIDQNAKSLELSQKHNFEIWDILNIYVWPNRVVTGSYQGEVDAVKNWLIQRMAWLNNQYK